VLEELFPPETVRGGQPDNRHTVTIDPGVPVFALVLHTTDQRAFPTYHVTVARIDRTTIWQGATTRSPHGTFVLGLPAGAFAVGRYRIELFGAREGRSMRIEAYELQVRGRAGDRSGDAAPRGRP